MRTLLILISAIVVLAACDNTGRSENRNIKKAAAIHEEILTRHDSIYSALLEKREDIEKRLANTPGGEMKVSYEAMIRSIDKSFRILKTWEESVVGVPGHEHHHHDHDGHHHHSHDHAKEAILEDMSDKEILELQEALKFRLDEVATEIRGLLTTIEMYAGDE